MESWNQVEIVRGLHDRLSAKLESVPVKRECNDKARINVAAQQDERAAIEHAMVRPACHWYKNGLVQESIPRHEQPGNASTQARDRRMILVGTEAT